MNPIVSFTSYKPRLKYCKTVIDSLLANTYKPWKIVMTLAKEDVQYIPADLQEYIDSGTVELIIADVDLRPHNKYFYSMQKYRENPIITVDDDIIYPEDLIQSLMDSYKQYPDCVHARRVHKKTYNWLGRIKPYRKWVFECKDVLSPSTELLATGVGGILYPPDILKISSNNIEDIMKVISVDDIYLHYLELKLGVRVVYVKNSMNHPPAIDGSQENGLYKINYLGNNNDLAINLLLKRRIRP